MGVEAAADLARLHASAFAAPWNAEALAEAIAAPFTLALRAGSAGAAQGFVLMRAAAEEAEILTLAVAFAARRCGVARALVEAAAALAATAGAQTLWLEVAEDNAAALALYASTGFEPAGRRRAYYARPGGAVDALMLRRALNRAPA